MRLDRDMFRITSNRRPLAHVLSAKRTNNATV